MANIRDINLNLLLVFDALMQEEHLSRAGDKMGLSQPGMSYSLNKLRELFNDPLFIHSKQGMKPTEKSTAIYPFIQAALSQVNKAIEFNKIFEPLSSKYDFRLGLSDYASFILLPKLYHLINTCAPNISLSVRNISSVYRKRALDDNEIDLAVGVYDTKPKNCQYVELYTEKIVCLYDPKIISLSNKLTIDQFIKHPHLLIDFREDPPLTIKKELSKYGLSRHVSITLPYVISSGQIIKGTNLLSAMPLHVAEIIAKQSGLKTTKLPITIQEYFVCLVWNKNNNHNIEIAWMREQIQAIFDVKTP